jgi:glycosyltransferase involved in cell wall biosynthesis
MPARPSQTRKIEVWLMSAYRTDSHARWADWLVDAHPHIAWKRLELPGRVFRWRIRGNPISWLKRLPDSQPDLIFATSMVDLATIKGLHPRLAGVPAWYYFHENQFAYPLSEHQLNRVDPQMVQLYGALAAERVFFNSEFNRRTFLDGVFDLLRSKPQADSQDIRRLLEARSTVLPIPIHPIPAAPEKDPRLILWNHRWEYDKAPEVFAEAMIRLAKLPDIDFKLALLGDRSETHTSPALLRLREEIPGRILIDERSDSETYRRIVGQSMVAVSTALHEFQGLAMLEAVSAGARPLVPDDLCYPEQYPEAFRYPAGDSAALIDRLKSWFRRGFPPEPDVSAWSSDALRRQWRELFSF